jgi:hypothetical protein
MTDWQSRPRTEMRFAARAGDAPSKPKITRTSEAAPPRADPDA